MEVTEIVDWLRSVGRFNDFEVEQGDPGTVADLPDASEPGAHRYPLGFHGSGCRGALWRRDPATPRGDAACVWIDSEGSPWEAFDSSAEEGLAALAPSRPATRPVRHAHGSYRGAAFAPDLVFPLHTEALSRWFATR